MKNKVENEEIEIFRCKTDKTQYFSEEALLEHFNSKHREQFTVRRVDEISNQCQEVTPDAQGPTKPKRKYTRKIVPDKVESAAIQPDHVENPST